MKLSRSSGFCPHRRCQLPNVTNSGHTSTCPKNLCYTKVEVGADVTSYNDNITVLCRMDTLRLVLVVLKMGVLTQVAIRSWEKDLLIVFSGGVIGHYFKSQPTPKPIYKYNRVILGGDSNDTSYESFISANEVCIHSLVSPLIHRCAYAGLSRPHYCTVSADRPPRGLCQYHWRQ